MSLKFASYLKIINVASFVGPILFSLLLITGLPLLEATKLTVVLLVQISAGVLCWNFFFPEQQDDTMLMIGAGTTAGICLATLTHQILLHSPFNSIAWLLPFLFFALLAQAQDIHVATIPPKIEISKVPLFFLL